MKSYAFVFGLIVACVFGQSDNAENFVIDSNSHQIKLWHQRQLFYQLQSGLSIGQLTHRHDGFYLVDSFLDQFEFMQETPIQRGRDSIYFWGAGHKAVMIEDWTLIPSDRVLPLGLVKVRWVTENGSYDKVLSILTQNFACYAFPESNTCFRVDLLTDSPRKFVRREYFDRLITWDITMVANGRYRLLLQWQNGNLLSPPFTIQHSTGVSP